MRHPLWMLNSALLVLLIVVLSYIVFFQQTLPERQDIEPNAYTKPVRAKVSEVNLRKIYEDDLFGTYIQEVSTPEETQGVPELPPPPVQKQPEPLVWQKPQFLEPISIALKGIIIVADDQILNSAIIADKKTNREGSYHVGDFIEDAQLLKIFNNKVIFLRTNGQQEVVYLRERDAKRDPAFALVEGWQDVIKPLGVHEYQINPREFTRRVLNLAQFIDLLDITTVYSKGISIGCRIGRVTEKSLGATLGFRSRDIIVSVDGIELADTPNRFEAYKQVIATAPGTPILVRVLRNNKEFVITYRLEESKETEDEVPVVPAESSQVPRAQPQVTRQQLDTLRQHHELAPTVDEIRRRDRAHMMQVSPGTGS